MVLVPVELRKPQSLVEWTVDVSSIDLHVLRKSKSPVLVRGTEG